MLTSAPGFASAALDLVNEHLRPGKQEFVPPQQVGAPDWSPLTHSLNNKHANNNRHANNNTNDNRHAQVDTVYSLTRYSLTRSLTHSLAHLLTHSLTHSPTHSLTRSLTHSLTCESRLERFLGVGESFGRAEFSGGKRSCLGFIVRLWSPAVTDRLAGRAGSRCRATTTRGRRTS
eukprot:1195483-Prorocentrum_minimum.AAC.2